MLKHISIGTLAACALAAVQVQAKDPPAAPMQAVSAPAELSQYDFFLGNWNCAGKTFASPAGPEHTTTAVVHAAKAVGGRWVHVTYDENKSAANPMPYHVGVYWGYDPARKLYVQACVDVAGGYCQQTGSGWSGDTFVFEGPGWSDGKQQTFRDTFTKKGTATLTHSGSLLGENKQWVQLDEETCNKTK